MCLWPPFPVFRETQADQATAREWLHVIAPICQALFWPPAVPVSGLADYAWRCNANEF